MGTTTTIARREREEESGERMDWTYFFSSSSTRPFQSHQAWNILLTADTNATLQRDNNAGRERGEGKEVDVKYYTLPHFLPEDEYTTTGLLVVICKAYSDI